jgi:hypothetical protein
MFPNRSAPSGVLLPVLADPSVREVVARLEAASGFAGMRETGVPASTEPETSGPARVATAAGGTG